MSDNIPVIGSKTIMFSRIELTYVGYGFYTDGDKTYIDTGDGTFQYLTPEETLEVFVNTLKEVASE